MRNEIVVRKNKALRIGLLVIYLLMVCLSILIFVLLFPLYYFGLFSLIGTLPILCVLLYYTAWRVSFSSKGIIIKGLFKRTKSYTYSQILDGYIANSFTLHQHVALLLCDNMRICFRMEDDNAKIALKIIQKHRSLRTLNW